MMISFARSAAVKAFNRNGIRYMSTAAVPRRLEGKVAVVTAATAGIGLAIAERLGQEGAHVYISSRKQENVDEKLAELRGMGLSVDGQVCHVGKKEHRIDLINNVVQKYGKIDVLVNNAAANPAFGPMMNTTEEQWEKIFDTNCKAAFFLTKEARPHMPKGSSITFVASIAGYQPLEGLGPYSVSKTALLGLVKALGIELAPEGIRVNGIAPGVIKTNFSEKLWDGSDSELTEKNMSSTPIRRFGLPSEMASVAAFLASDDAAYVTCETIVAAGGMYSHL
eukprot:Clim_evm4s42 gene=Clim_evmTU4s42